MKWFRSGGVLVAGLLWLAAGVGCACAANGDEKSDKAETVVIPLDQIWALDMPGTRSIRKLEAVAQPELLLGIAPEESSGARSRTLWTDIAVSLTSESTDWPSEGQTARPGFSVLGIGKEAFQNAHKILVKGEQPQQSFVVGDKVSLVFFSYGMGAYVHIREVKKSGHEIEIGYRFAIPSDKIRSVHMALIPLGNAALPLPVGNYVVQLKTLPSAYELGDRTFKTVEDRQKYSSVKEWATRFVCHPYSFSIREIE